MTEYEYPIRETNNLALYKVNQDEFVCKENFFNQ